MIPASLRPYGLLIAILSIGAVTAAVVVSLQSLASHSGNTSLSLKHSAAALAAARTCAERALRSLQSDTAYAGNETVTLADGQCTIRPIGGEGDSQRALCAEGSVGGGVRRLEIVLRHVLPAPAVLYWKEVPEFSLC